MVHNIIKFFFLVCGPGIEFFERRILFKSFNLKNRTVFFPPFLIYIPSLEVYRSMCMVRLS